MKKNARIGILGGTFNPVHHGHLLAAECVRNALQLEKIIIIPTANPPHKNVIESTDEKQRMQMVKLACESNLFFEVSALEIERPGISYTIDTMRQLRSTYPHSTLFLILGTDALLLIKTWKHYREVLSLCTLVIVTRPGYIVDRNMDELQSITENFWDETIFVEIPRLDISSQMIRQRIAEGKSIKYLLPAKVEEYIYENKLYCKE